METTISTEGYIFIILAWGSVSTLLAFCLYKVLRTPKNPDKSDNY
jgi:hypothetical protein